jgi:hypothetical protein
MSPTEIIRQLEALELDLGFQDADLGRLRAIREAIAIVQERSGYDWLASQDSRAQVDRVRIQLDALGSLLGNLSETLGRVVDSVPRGYQRDTVEHARRTVDDAFDSILHPSFYRKMNP